MNEVAAAVASRGERPAATALARCSRGTACTQRIVGCMAVRDRPARHLARRDRRRRGYTPTAGGCAASRLHARDGAREEADHGARRGHAHRPLGQGRRLYALRQVRLHGRRHRVHERQGQLRVPGTQAGDSSRRTSRRCRITVDVHYDPANPQRPTSRRTRRRSGAGSSSAASSGSCSAADLRGSCCDRDDLRHLRRCVELAELALDIGDEPFGSVLVARRR